MPELFFQFFSFGDVLFYGEKVGYDALMVPYGCDSGLFIEGVSIFLSVLKDPMPLSPGPDSAPERLPFVQRGTQKEVRLPADNLIGGIARDFGELRVYVLYDALSVCDHDGGGALLERLRQLAYYFVGLLVALLLLHKLQGK
ncbi:hypothetical protein MBAV_004012 [Candidatus Magnetobacterium bavaricum]|uniref:Uncharacterized protein n=1 Tax=Candidatus Magnetobacterium bavaricum TaxID=29290 RepID=A0A0F3GPE4_9BACT|nr:hypothetical protein MBAV_004012 [Candidatus Magnetobacterium bavaricum]